MVSAAESGFEADEAVGGCVAESLHVPVDGAPEVTVLRLRRRWNQVESQGAVAGANDVFAELVLVGGEDTDATASAGDADVPLLTIGGGFDGRVGEQDVVHGLPLGAVGGDGVAGLELPKAWVENPVVGKGDSTIGFDGLHGHQFAVCDTGAGGHGSIGLQMEAVAMGEGNLPG